MCVCVLCNVNCIHVTMLPLSKSVTSTMCQNKAANIACNSMLVATHTPLHHTQHCGAMTETHDAHRFHVLTLYSTMELVKLQLNYRVGQIKWGQLTLLIVTSKSIYKIKWLLADINCIQQQLQRCQFYLYWKHNMLEGTTSIVTNYQLIHRPGCKESRVTCCNVSF